MLEGVPLWRRSSGTCAEIRRGRHRSRHAPRPRPRRRPGRAGRATGAPIPAARSWNTPIATLVTGGPHPPNLDRLHDGHGHDDSPPPRSLGQQQSPPPTADAVDGCPHRSPRRRRAANEQVRARQPLADQDGRVRHHRARLTARQIAESDGLDQARGHDNRASTGAGRPDHPRPLHAELHQRRSQSEAAQLGRHRRQLVALGRPQPAGTEHDRSHLPRRDTLRDRLRRPEARPVP